MTFSPATRRVAFVVASIAAASAACKKGTAAVTAPLVTDTLSVAGSWTGCIVQPNGSCSPVNMTLADSSLSDTSAAVTGTGNWGANVTIKGRLVDSQLTVDATTVGVIEGWSYSAALSGHSLSGVLTIPGNASSFTATFTRTP
jgi:hypothetical protein